MKIRWSLFLDNGDEPRSEKMKEVLSEWSDTIFLITTYESDAADLVLPVTTDPEFMTFNFIVLLQLICGEILICEVSILPHQKIRNFI